jgi:hypothetical protein
MARYSLPQRADAMREIGKNGCEMFALDNAEEQTISQTAPRKAGLFFQIKAILPLQQRRGDWHCGPVHRT